MTLIIQTIKQQFSQVIQYSQNIKNPKIDKIFDEWLEAKRDIIEAWGGKYTIEMVQPITFELSQAEKEKRLDEFIISIIDTYENEDLACFLANNKEDFFDNHLSKNYCYGPDKVIPKGTKIIKAFKYFESDARALADLQSQASMIIQEDKVSGTLCFSVHPLDFLSTSETTYHWRSCHALDGDYRAGNLSYMLDKSTIICYLRGEDGVKLPSFPDSVRWNSKKWRMLIFLSDGWDAMFAGRQYPFFSPGALDIVRTALWPTLGLDKFDWSGWHNDQLEAFPRSQPGTRFMDSELDVPYISMRGKIYSLYDTITDGEKSLHFNDLLRSSCYIPYYTWNRKAWKKIPHFSIGTKVPCLYCEKEYLDFNNSMLCRFCEEEYGEGEDDNFAYCECCQRRTYREELHWNQSVEGYICEDCHNEHAVRCECCGESWYQCDITYSHRTERYLCPHCMNRYG